MTRYISLTLVVVFGAWSTGCQFFSNFFENYDRAYGECKVVGPQDWPETLSKTGLFTEMRSQELSVGVKPFTPRFELWSDGAKKDRYVFLPPGAVIESRQMDHWQFPVGTKFWKTFTRDGVKVETRLLERVGEGEADWRAVSYIWNEDESDAVAAPEGAANARGTPHDVPSATECMGCHAGKQSRVLGFSAIQLAGPFDDGRLSLATLQDAGQLSKAPVSPLSIPGNATEQAALGYLHANCSHCHNARRPDVGDPECFDPQLPFDFTLWTDMSGALHQTSTYKTAIGSVIVPGAATKSKAYKRMGQASPYRPAMPPIGTEVEDVAGKSIVAAWIDSLVLAPSSQTR